MSSFEAELKTRLDAIRDQGLYRELRRVDSPQASRIQVAGKTFLNFSSNDYLGLANEPSLKEAAIKAVERFGAGCGASRLICGSLAPHHELEEALADFKQCEAALTFSSGYTAAVGTICALLGKEDVIVLDKLVHASIVDAARLSGARIRIFDHNDLGDLEKILQWANRTRSAESGTPKRRVLVVTESVFSMDGDCAPLPEIAALKEKHGAWLMVDEAHATGLYGANRRGLAEEKGMSGAIEIQMGTLGKALGASGGYICGTRTLIDFLINRARSFIFSTAPVPASAAAANAGLEFVRSRAGEERRNILWQRVRSLKSQMRMPEAGFESAIIPLMIGDETKAVAAAALLREQKIFVPAIRYPTVARGQARLRVTMTAAHCEDDIKELSSALGRIGNVQSPTDNRPSAIRNPQSKIADA